MLFAYRLCLALGRSHPDHLLRELTAKQYAQWAAYYRIDPFGDQRDDLRAGIICATMNNRWRGKNENPAAPVDFMPYHKESDQTPEEIKRTLQSILDQVTQHG